ncbi:MAG TPA: hypothetical protein VNF04_08915 [Stellaceae bacterium]|nr:hypothetical protein [Stellaceae bacterium]
MAIFTTRVELHGADEDDYETLHAEMKARRFTQTISASGKTYQLPTAEYNYRGNVTKHDVLNKAKAAASKTNRTYSILVTQSNGRTWTGLREVGG